MPLPTREAVRRLRTALAEVAPDARLDHAAVRWIANPYPGYAYGLRLGEANVLLFMPVHDIDGDGWPARLRNRLQEAARYLEGFPLAHIGR